MSWGDEWGFEWGAVSELDVVARATSRVFTRLRNASSDSDEPSVEDVVSWIAEQIQTVEDTIAEIRAYVPLANAVGQQLDTWGLAVRQPRGGLDDDDYRATLMAIYGSIAQRRTPTLIAALLDLLVEEGTTSSYREHYPAAFEVDLVDVEAGRAVLIESVVRRAKLEGVRFTMHVVEDSAAAFHFDTAGEGFDSAPHGWTYTLES